MEAFSGTTPSSLWSFWFIISLCINGMFFVLVWFVWFGACAGSEVGEDAMNERPMGRCLTRRGFLFHFHSIFDFALAEIKVE